MPQNEYIEEHIKRHGRRLDHEERMRKREARGAHKSAAMARKTIGLKAKMMNKKRRAESLPPVFARPQQGRAFDG